MSQGRALHCPDLSMNHSSRTSPFSIRLGIVSNGDPTDVRSWSGVPNAILNHIEPKVGSVVYLPAAPVSDGRKHWERLRKGAARCLGHRALPHLDRRHLEARVQQISEASRRESVDAILAITVDQFVAHLDVDVPVLHHSDTTFEGLENWYPHLTRLWPVSSRRGHEIAEEALRRSDHSIYPSRWAANQATRHYGVQKERITVAPYGCNLLNPPSREETLQRAIIDGGKCRLLFIGLDWERKGGPLVLDTLRILRARGVDASLSVVGTTPPETDLPVETIPFLNKQIPEDLERYRSLWREASFLFMPSLAETFGAIYAEAAANGVPSIALDIGGVGDAVADRESGLLLTPDIDADACADAIVALLESPEDYHALVRGSRDRYETTLNWNAWCTTSVEILKNILSKRREENVG